MKTLFIKHASELVPVSGPDEARAGRQQGQVEILSDGAVYCEDGRIKAVGSTAEVRKKYPEVEQADEIIDASGRAVIPGLVDCHSHPVFAGDRSDEYAMRLEGKPYREILAGGGGILKSVRHTRAASHDELLSGLRERLDRALALGTTTMEAKSGYGLDEPTERKMLEVIRSANEGAGRHPIDLVPTLLYAHAMPLGVTASEMADSAIAATPKLASLAEFVDVFCERGIFELEDSRRVLEAGKKAGLDIKVHADEMCLLGGAKLAAELGGVSADHLLFADDEGIEAMRKARTVAVFLPGTPFVLREGYSNARRWIAGNVPVALATDLNPNCYCESLPFVFVLGAYEMKMTPAEALVGVTINAAVAIRREKEIGSLVPGKLADIVVLKGPTYLHLGYHIGGNPIRQVIKRGKVVWRDGV